MLAKKILFPIPFFIIGFIAFSIAVNQVNGHIQQKFLPGKLPTLPSIAKVFEINDTGIAFKYDDKINYVENQDVHILDKEVANV